MLVHALASRTHHRCQLLLCKTHVDRRPGGHLAPVVVGQLQQLLGQPARDVEKDRVLHKLVRLA